LFSKSTIYVLSTFVADIKRVVFWLADKVVCGNLQVLMVFTRLSLGEGRDDFRFIDMGANIFFPAGKYSYVKVPF